MKNALMTIDKTRILAQMETEIERDPRLKSGNTKRGYRHDLSRFEEWRAGRSMTKLVVEEYAAKLQQMGKSPNTINRALAAVRWWARRVADLAFEGDLSKQHREEIVTQALRVAAVKDVTGERGQKGRHITAGEFRALIRACEHNGSPAGARDAALFAVAWQTGARRSELAGLALSDYSPTGDDVEPVTIKGKGDKTRTGYVSNGALDALADWLDLRGTISGPLFLAVNKGGAILDHGLSSQALAQMLAKRAEQADVKTITWHDFRRSFAGNLLDDGADLVTVQKLMGHSSPITTSGYDRRGEETRRKAVRCLHVPYRRRS